MHVLPIIFVCDLPRIGISPREGSLFEVEISQLPAGGDGKLATAQDLTVIPWFRDVHVCMCACVMGRWDPGLS